jgi:23S rRNA pseudouridine2605 synthase
VKKQQDKKFSDEQRTRLNKFIAGAGICSRREADELIQSGLITVNGKTVTELGYRVSPRDVVKYAGETLMSQVKVYVLLNKPKDYITTLDDEYGRKNVLELVRDACAERIYPIGRLDRNSTGVLLFTNDGDLTKKLTHPRYRIPKGYQVMLDKNLKPHDLDEIASGIQLEDGFIRADEIFYAGRNRNEIHLEIHSGRNRIIRRMFEHVGYRVLKLDRVMFAGLTKKDLQRGQWRYLIAKEVEMLKTI